MAYSHHTSAADGTTSSFGVPFNYLDKSHIHVYIDGTEVPAENLSWNTPSSFSLPSVPAAGAAVLVRRRTPSDDVPVEYSAGVLSAGDLNQSALWALYVAQETQDDAATATSYADDALTTLSAVRSLAEEAEAAAISAATSADAVAAKADKSTTLSGYGITDAYTKTETDDRFEALVGAAPAALDTLEELGARLVSEENEVAAVVTTLSTKLATAEAPAVVRSTVLAGLSTATSAVIVVTDTVLSALGKLQAQVSGVIASAAAHIARTDNPHGVTKAQIGLGSVPNVDATARAAHTGTQTSSTISDFSAAASAAAPVQSVAGRGGAVTLTKSDVGLGSVSNLAPADLPVSTAATAAISAKQDALGYTPVQQGSGNEQTPNAVKIGWSAAAKLRVQVDWYDFGTTWPIDIAGAAASLTSGATVPTPDASDDSTKAANTAWVRSAITASISGVASFQGRTGAITLTASDVVTAMGASDFSISGAVTTKALSISPTSGSARAFLNAPTSDDQSSITFAVGGDWKWQIGLQSGGDWFVYNFDLGAYAVYVTKATNSVQFGGQVIAAGGASLPSIGGAGSLGVRANGEVMLATGVYNVRFYGAVGDGSADDTAAINAAITALVAGGGGVLYFPRGFYKITSALTTIHNVDVSVRGDGIGVSVILASGLPSSATALSIYAASASYHVRVDGLEINTATAGSGCGLAVEFGDGSSAAIVQHMTLTDILVRGSDTTLHFSTGIRIVNANKYVVRNVHVTGAQTDATPAGMQHMAMGFDVTSTTRPTQMQFAQCSVTFAVVGFNFAGTMEGVQLTQPLCVACGTGIKQDTGDTGTTPTVPHFSISDGHFDVFTKAIDIKYMAQGFITNNLIYKRIDANSDTIGISVYASSNVVIANNHLLNNNLESAAATHGEFDAVSLTYASRVLVYGNTFGNLRYGVICGVGCAHVKYRIGFEEAVTTSWVNYSGDTSTNGYTSM